MGLSFVMPLERGRHGRPRRLAVLLLRRARSRGPTIRSTICGPLLGDRSQGDLAGIERLDFRRAKVKEAIDQMKTDGQLRRLILDEWKVDPKRIISPELRELDNEMRAIVGDRLAKCSMKKAAEKGDGNARLRRRQHHRGDGPAVRPLDPTNASATRARCFPIVVHLTKDDDLGVRQEALRALSNINAGPRGCRRGLPAHASEGPQIGPATCRRRAEQMVKSSTSCSVAVRRSGVDATREDLLRGVLAVGPVAAVAIEDSDVEVRMLA